MDPALNELENLTIPDNFVQTAEGYDGERRRKMPTQDDINPQTEKFLEMIGCSYNLFYGAETPPRVHNYFSNSFK